MKIDSLKQNVKFAFLKTYSCVKSNRLRHFDNIIVRLDAIGDFIIWLGSAKQMRAAWKDQNICLVCRDAISQIAQQSGLFDCVITINSFKDCIIKLSSLEATRLINPRYSRDVMDYYATILVKANTKIAIDGDASNLFGVNKSKWDKIFDMIYSSSTSLEPEITYNQEFTNYLLKSSRSAQLADLSFVPSNKKSESYFVINLGASSAIKRWPVDNFVLVAEYIYSLTKERCVLIGSQDEYILSEQFQSKYRYPLTITTGKTTVLEMISIIQSATLVISNDTSSGHIAIAAGVKSFVVAPGFHYPRFTEYPAYLFSTNDPVFISKATHCNGCMLENHQLLPECEHAVSNNCLVKCVKDVSADDVISAIDSYFKAATHG